MNIIFDRYSHRQPAKRNYDDVESFHIIFLNAKNKLLGMEKMFTGTLTSASVYPREIVKKVLEYKSPAIILVHNHPSGDVTPSSSDFAITIRIGVILDSMGVCIHDHLIIGEGYYSMTNNGDLKQIQDKIAEFK